MDRKTKRVWIEKGIDVLKIEKLTWWQKNKKHTRVCGGNGDVRNRQAQGREKWRFERNIGKDRNMIKNL